MEAVVEKVSVENDSMEFDINILHADDSTDIREMELLDASGEEIRSSRNTMKSKFADQKTNYKISFYGIKPPLTEADLSYEYCPDMTKEAIPFSVTTQVREQGTAQPSTPAKPAPPPAAAKPEPPPSQASARDEEPPDAEETVWPDLQITGILGKGKNGSAFINGAIIDVDNTVEGVKLIELQSGCVIMEFKGEKRKIFLNR